VRFFLLRDRRLTDRLPIIQKFTKKSPGNASECRIHQCEVAMVGETPTMEKKKQRGKEKNNAFLSVFA